MILISCRKHGSKAQKLAEGFQNRIWDADTPNLRRENGVGNYLSMEELMDKVRDKKVLLLVHGYNSQNAAFKAYEEIETNVKKWVGPHHYEMVVGFLWPGGNSKNDCNCSPLGSSGLCVVHLYHVGGVSGERDLDGDERVVSECRHGTQVA